MSDCQNPSNNCSSIELVYFSWIMPIFSNNSTTIPNFEPYTHQAGGHCCILKFDGRLCKPLVQRECEFYRTIHRDVPLLATITPEFYGCVVVSPNKTSLLENDNNDNNSTQDQARLQGTSVQGETSYIVLQDLTAGMSRPCVMDMKVRLHIHQYAPHSFSLRCVLHTHAPQQMGTHRQRYDTSVALGFRICGMRVWRESGLYSVDRFFGRGLTCDTIEDAVGAFLFDGSCLRTYLIPAILNKLRNIIAVVELSPFRFYTSSLLFIYDADEDSSARVDVRLVDFAHATSKHTKEGETDDGFLFGMRNLVSLFTQLLERSSGSSDSDSDVDSADVHSLDAEGVSTDEDMESNDNITAISGRTRSRCGSFTISSSTSVEIHNSAGF